MRRQQLTKGISQCPCRFARLYRRYGCLICHYPSIARGIREFCFWVWQALQRFTGAISVADGRSSQVLKWVIANHQDSTDDAQKRRDIGAALWAWGSPGLLVFSSVVVWLSPYVAKIPPEMYPSCT